ncbi:MAG: methylmalonyl-CoA mutase [Chloroflexi bacterium]|nr:methylmalonyl-CoA mutase [Chloroflexota bacterium]
MRKDLTKAKQSWEDELARSGRPERREHFETESGIRLEPFYLPDGNYLEDQGFPGQLPFTRGAQPTMYRGRLWTMRQYAGYADAAETNRRFQFLLDQGQSGLSVAFDLPTQIGYDADDPIAEGEVGKVGVSISCLEDMETLFRGIPLDQVSTSMTINAPAAILLAMYIAVARRQGIDPAVLRGTIQNDILKEYVARGTYIFPPEPAMRLITDVFQYCRQTVPLWNTISVSGYHMREAGCTAVQEIAFTLANGIAYVEAAIQSGLEVDQFAPRLTFFFNAHNDLLEEVAKFRAARRLWARLMIERFGALDPRSIRLRFHAQTAGSTLTAQQPENNVVRVALQALAAVLGGAQSLHTNSMDEALGLPTERAARTALRTQQILAHEMGVADTIDPLGGSFLIEHLTDEIEAGAREHIAKIDELGGALAAVDSGYMQSEIQEAAYQAQMRMESEETVVVGVNAYRSADPVPMKIMKVDPTVASTQRENLSKLRKARDAGRVEDQLKRLKRAAEGTDNLMPIFIDCLEADVTLGEICGRLRAAWGEHVPVESF